jgi:molybdopterin-binding protein
VGKLAGAGPIETVIRGDAVEADKSLGYATVKSNGFEMHVPLGTKAFVTLRADEVILSVGQVPKISTRNVWNGLISRIHRFETRTVVEVNVGQKILAEVTEDAVIDLALEVGSNAYALIKIRSLRATALQ